MKDPAERLAVAPRVFGEYGGVNAAIEVATTFTVMHADTLPEIFAGEKGPDRGGCYLYGRSFSPSVAELGKKLAALEGGDAAYCCSSGMAAISATLLALCSAGDHIVASNAVYGGTFALLKDFLPSKCGIHTTSVPIDSLESVAAAITDKTRVIYTETMSNPTLVLADIPALAQLAHERGIKLVVDATFTPMIISPLRLGADVVVHSLTKFVSGASDIIAGAICAADGRFIGSLMDLHLGPLMLLGPTMDPKVASELSLRLPHLGLRMTEHSRRWWRKLGNTAVYSSQPQQRLQGCQLLAPLRTPHCAAFSERLEALGAGVTYPGLPTHPQHALLQRLANPGYGAGGLLTLDLGSLERAKCFMERLQNKHGFGLMAVSLGYFDSLMSASAASTSSELTPQELAHAGISTGLVRISVGLTGSLEQRWGQLEEAYRHVAAAPLEARPAWKAAQVTRCAITGTLKRTPSWHSFGSSFESEDTEAEAEEVRSAAAALGAGAAGSGRAPAMKVRRLTTNTEVHYERVEPAVPAASAAAGAVSEAAT